MLFIYERVYIILIPKFKNDFINIINNFENKLSNLESINAIIEQLDLLYKNLVINNDEILKLPKFSKKICLKLLNDIKTLKNLIYRFSILKKYNFENDAYNELIKIAQMIFKFKQYYCLNYKFRNVDVYSRIIDLMEYFNIHILNVGFGFAINFNAPFCFLAILFFRRMEYKDNIFTQFIETKIKKPLKFSADKPIPGNR